MATIGWPNVCHWTVDLIYIAIFQYLKFKADFLAFPFQPEAQATVPIFLLVPQVRLPKRLDLARDAEWAADAVPGWIVGKWVEGRL